MKIDKIRTISFSPTGNSKRVVEAIVSAIPGIPVEHMDRTSPDAVSSLQCGPQDLVVIGVPVYAGRVAPLAVRRLQDISGDKTPAVIVVTYGNREFEDALIELKDLAEHAGFLPIAAGAFIGEHSFSGPETPIAAGRPDSQDLTAAKAFGEKISKKLSDIEDWQDNCCLEVPGNRPYKDGMGKLPFTPLLLADQCTQCELCIAACPTGAISFGSQIQIDQNLCIFCCSCIKTCPENALVIDAPPLQQKRQSLYEQCSKRKEPQIYL
jgi:ferredoxin